MDHTKPRMLHQYSFNAAMPAMGLVLTIRQKIEELRDSFNAAMPAMGLV